MKHNKTQRGETNEYRNKDRMIQKRRDERRKTRSNKRSWLNTDSAY